MTEGQSDSDPREATTQAAPADTSDDVPGAVEVKADPALQDTIKLSQPPRYYDGKHPR